MIRNQQVSSSSLLAGSIHNLNKKTTYRRNKD